VDHSDWQKSQKEDKSQMNDRRFKAAFCMEKKAPHCESVNGRLDNRKSDGKANVFPNEPEQSMPQYDVNGRVPRGEIKEPRRIEHALQMPTVVWADEAATKRGED
jgi:hypothetical protein